MPDLMFERKVIRFEARADVCSRAMKDDALNHAVDYAVGAGAIGIQSYAQAEMISEQLGREDFIRSAQGIVSVRGNGGNHFVE